MNALRKMGLISWTKLIPEFGYILPFKLAFWAFFKLICPKSFINYAFLQKHKLIKKWLYVRYHDIFEKKATDICHSDSPTIKIWVFWWQGEKNMPEVVKRCYNRLKLININKEVILIDKENYRNYVDLPDYINKKVGLGISLAHLSDLLRVNLLYNYGGIWVDATVFFIKPIPEEYFKIKFFTIKDHQRSAMSPACHRWTTFFMCASKHSPYMKKLVDAFNMYWKENDRIIDYLLIDYFLSILYDTDQSFQQLIDDMKFSDFNVHDIEKLKDDYDKNYINELKRACLFKKLSYKSINDRELMNSNTNYRALMEM